MTDEPWQEVVRDLELGPDTTLAELLDQFSRTGGFVAAKLATAADIMRGMQAAQRNGVTAGTAAARGGAAAGPERDCTNFLSFPADIMATGCRGVIRDLVGSGFVDVIITTCGTLDHDLARVLADYYCGSFEMDDVALREAGINRLGNVLIPDTSYGIPLERFMQPLLEQLYREREAAGTDEEGPSGSSKGQRWTGVDLVREIGLRLPALVGREKAEQTLLYQAARREVPIFVPGLSDGAFGSQLWQFYQSHKRFTLDVLAEEHLLSDLIFEARATGALMVGGGISKHHTIWWNQFRGGLDFVVQITSAPEWDGSLSGARIREAVSWGKVRPEARHITLEGDATILLPLLAAAVL